MLPEIDPPHHPPFGLGTSEPFLRRLNSASRSGPRKNGSCRHTAAILPPPKNSIRTSCGNDLHGRRDWPISPSPENRNGALSYRLPCRDGWPEPVSDNRSFRNIRLYNNCIIPVPYSRDIHSRHHRPNSSDSEINNTSRAGPRQPTAAHWRPKTRRYGKNGASATPRPISPGQSYSKVRHRQPCGHLPQA